MPQKPLTRPQPVRAPSPRPSRGQKSPPASESQSPPVMESQPSQPSPPVMESPLPPEVANAQQATPAYGDADHLDALASTLGSQQAEVSAVVADVVPKAAWVEGAIQAFGLASVVFRLQTLKIQQEEYEAAQHAMGAIYDTALEVAWLRPLIAPGNPWVLRVVAVGAFAWPKVQLVRAEIELKRLKAAEPKPVDQSGDGEKSAGGAD